RSGAELSDYLAQHGVPGIDGVDTRMLTRRVRDHGEQRVLITRDTTSSDAELVAKVKAAPRVADVDHVLEVTTKSNYHWERGYESTFNPPAPGTASNRPKIVAYDFGAKRNILRSLAACG